MKINGRERNYPSGITINELLNKLKLPKEIVIVKVDNETIPKDNYNRKLNKDSNIEVRSFIGGG